MPDKNKKINGGIELTITNEIKLNPTNPIPINYGGDSFYIARDKRYIPFLGKDNNLPNLLLEARLTSTTQNACITSIAQSVVGNGLIVLDNATPDKEFINWTKDVNNDQQSLNDVMVGCVDGERTHGNEFIELVKGEVAGKRYLKIYIHSMLTCRLGAEDPKTGKPTDVIISNQFAKKSVTQRLNKPTQIPLWSPNELEKNKCWKKMEDGTERSMLHFKNEVSGVDHYGLPASVAGLRYQVLEGRSAQFNLDNFDNNMVLGGMLILKSAMTAEEAQETAKKVMLSHIGAGKTGRIAVISSETGLDDVDFKEYKTEKEGSFIEFDKRIEEKIIASNAWAKEFCFSDSAAMGKGGAYLKTLWDLKEAVLLKPLRNRLIEKVVRPMIKVYAEVYAKKEIADYEFGFKAAMPFSFIGDINPETFMQVNEGRKLAGLEPDEKKNDIYLSEMTTKKKDSVGK